MLAVSVASLDYMPYVGEKAKRLLREVVDALGGVASLPEKSGKLIITGLNDAERVSIEAKHYAAILAVMVTDRIARLVYTLAARSEKPVILLVDPEGWSLPDALDAYNVLRGEGFGVSQPLLYPTDMEKLRLYTETATRLGEYRGTALLFIGSTPIWTLYGQIDENRFRSKLDATIIRMDINDVVLRFEETSIEEARRVLDESLSGASIEADIDLLVNELKLYAALSRLVHENRVSMIAANCSELVGKFGGVYIAGSLLMERDSVPLACDNDAAAAMTSALLAIYGDTMIVRPVKIRGERVEYEALMAPPSLLENPSIVFDDRLGGLILRGKPRIEGSVVVARVDPQLRRLYTRSCILADTREEPRPTMMLDECSGVAEFPGSQHVLLVGESLEKLEVLARLLGLSLVVGGREY